VSAYVGSLKNLKGLKDHGDRVPEGPPRKRTNEAEPRKSLGRGCHKLILPQGSGFQRWRSSLKALLNEFTLSNILAWKGRLDQLEAYSSERTVRLLPGGSQVADLVTGLDVIVEML